MVVCDAEFDASVVDAGVDGGAAVPLEVLERRLTTWAARIAAAEAQWFGWLGEYDAREGWAEWGCVSAAHWLSWKCGIAGSAGRERVRVARALRDLPVLFAEFEAGRLTYSKVRAVTRVANEFNEVDVVSVALSSTGAQLEQIVRAMKPQDGETQSDAAAFAARSWTKRRNHDGTTTYTVRVLDGAAAVIDNRLESEVDALIDDATPEGVKRRDTIAERGGIAAVRSDAGVALLTGAAGGAAAVPAEVTFVVDADQHNQHQCCNCGASAVSAETPAEQGPHNESVVPAETSNPGQSRVLAETSANQAPPELTRVPAETSVEPTPQPAPRSESPVASKLPAGTCCGARPAASALEPGDYIVGGGHVSPAVGRRLCCDPRITALVESALTGEIGVGRTTRLIPRRLRRALERRDNHACQFPGCAATQRLHAHHIVHWADGGPTELDNLILLCHFHHHLIHDAGWTINTATRQFSHPDRGPINHNPDLDAYNASLDRLEPPIEWLEPDPGHLEPHAYDRMDLAWITTVIAENERLAQTAVTSQAD